MRLSDMTDTAAAVLREAGGRLGDLMTPTVRLGVTGLARAGKTVLITSLIRNLAGGSRLPFLSAMAEGRIARVYLEPQPDDRIARFAYEEHLGELAGDPPEWPESTRAVSQLRLTVEYSSASVVWRTLTPGRLHIDIVDYPGEWLLDLPMLDLDFATWSAEALADARARGGLPSARVWLDLIAALDPAGPAEESRAIEGARLFTAYLQEARAADATLAAPLIAPGPGRFLLPGDLAGSPLLTFFPLPPPAGASGYPRGSLGAMLGRRFDSYKAHVVEPFFRDYFARLDRQIVLVDALSAVNAGAPSLRELERTLTAVLACFKPGASRWLSRLLFRRIDRILIAATKADHLHHTSHDRLEAILRLLTDKAIARAEYAGAEVKVMALAAIRATREAEARMGGVGGLLSGERLPCIVGVPLPGERLGRKVFDGQTEAAVFPGDLPDNPASVLDGTSIAAGAETVHFPRFRPPRLDLAAGSDAPAAPPHIRLDRALEFLLGDKLA